MPLKNNLWFFFMGNPVTLLFEGLNAFEKQPLLFFLRAIL